MSNTVSQSQADGQWMEVTAETKIIDLVQEDEDGQKVMYWDAAIDNYVIFVGLPLTFEEAYENVYDGYDVLARDFQAGLALVNALNKGNKSSNTIYDKEDESYSTYHLSHFHVNRDNPAHVFIL